MSKLIILYMIIQNLVNIDVEQMNLLINTNNTRDNNLRLVLRALRTNIMLHFFAYTTGKKWNTLLINVISASSLHIFKLRLACICLDDL